MALVTAILALLLPAPAGAYPATGTDSPKRRIERVSAPDRPTPLLPVGSWNVEGANGRCLASRDFGNARKPITLAFKVHLFSGMEVMIVEPSVYRETIRETQNMFEPGRADPRSGDPVVTLMRIAPLARSKQVVEFRLSHDEFGVVRKTGEMWTYSLHHNRRFKLSAIDDVGRLLDSCEEALAAEFGLPIEEQRRLAVLPVEKSNRPIFTSDDYPRAALDKSIGGPTFAIVMVGADGKAESCRTVEKSGSPDLDEKLCTVFIKRAHFLPARDTEGKAVRALFPFHVNWIIGYD